MKYYHLVTIYWLVCQLDTSGLTPSLLSKANNFKFLNFSFWLSPWLHIEKTIHGHLIEVYLKFQWWEEEKQEKTNWNLSDWVCKITKKSFGATHTQVNSALSLWTYYGMICKLFLCSTYRFETISERTWFNSALVEYEIRVLKLFTFFALGEGGSLQSSI